MFRYTPDRQMRIAMNRTPAIARDRAQLAAMYRAARQDHPAIARALFRSHKAAQRKLAEMIIGNVMGVGNALR